MNTHIPVMLPEVCGILGKAQNLRFVVDATLGLGGYSEGVLLKWRKAVVLGIDQDPQAIEAAKRKLMDFGDRFRAVHGNFRDLSPILEKTGMGKPDAVLFDLGVSSIQIETPERGFSFQEDGPLDMRMDSQSERQERAGDIINTAGMRDLITLFRKYGEDPYAAQIARGIVRYRESSGPIKSTSELVQVIRNTLPAPVQRKMGRNPARKVFQALRIAVNDELEALADALNQCESLASGAMMVIVVSYHSLEDRIVKRKFREWDALGRGNDLYRKPLVPGAEELKENWRSRSAKLRAFSFLEKVPEVTDR